MRFTRAREDEVLATLREQPEAHVVFPARAYRPDGRILIYEGKARVFLHRHLFEVLIAPLPTRWFLLQTCDREGCQNPFHFEASASPHGLVAIKSDRDANAVKTHCVRGHAFTKSNTYVDPRGKRVCRTCDRERAAERRRRKEAA